MKKRSIILIAKSVWRKPAARVLASFSILAILIYSVPFSDLWNTVTQISIVLWVCIVIAFLFGHLVAVVKWTLFINMGQNTLSFALAAQCYFAGLFANLFLPSLAGGDVVRAGLAIRYKVDKETVIMGGLADRFLDISALGLIIILSSIYSHTSLSVEFGTLLSNLFIIISGIVIFISAILTLPVQKIIPESVNKKIEPFRNIFKRLLKDPQRALGAFSISLAIQSGFVILNAILGMACNINLPLSIWFIVWPLAKLSAMIPISLGGLGVRETALALLLARFGVPFSSSVGVGLLWESVLIAGGLVGGFFYFFAKKKFTTSKLAIEDGAS